MNFSKPKAISICVISIFQSIVCMTGMAQTVSNDYPEVGKACPDFTIRDVSHFPKETISPSDFRGKWLILDFWSQSCTTCIRDFPKVNQLQKDFRKDVQFLLIAPNTKKNIKGVKMLYEKLFQKYNLVIPAAYDSALFDRFGIDSVPHIIILDRDGRVVGITTSDNLNHENIQNLLLGNISSFETKLNAYEKEVQINTGNENSFLDDPLKESDFFHQSIFATWKGETPFQIRTNIEADIGKGNYHTTGTSLVRLYNIAYIGASDWSFGDSLYAQFSSYPILETKDSLPFKQNFSLKEGYYSYSLTVPKAMASRRYLQMAMQCDLKKYFGYEVSVETRKMPCWELVVTTDRIRSKLRTKGEIENSKVDHSGFTLTNAPLSRVLKIVSGFYQGNIPFFDATGITHNIDISIEAILIDFNDVKRALRQKGLDLIESKRELKVLVIR